MKAQDCWGSGYNFRMELVKLSQLFFNRSEQKEYTSVDRDSIY